MGGTQESIQNSIDRLHLQRVSAGLASLPPCDGTTLAMQPSWPWLVDLARRLHIGRLRDRPAPLRLLIHAVLASLVDLPSTRAMVGAFSQRALHSIVEVAQYTTKDSVFSNSGQPPPESRHQPSALDYSSPTP